MRIALLIAALIAALSLVAAGTAARGGHATFTLTFLSATPGVPYGIAQFTVQRPARKQDNIYAHVQLITTCDDGAKGVSGDTAWVGTDGFPMPIVGAYIGTQCHAWVILLGGNNPSSSPASNIVDFTG
jgi:hypothetical protein